MRPIEIAINNYKNGKSEITEINLRDSPSQLVFTCSKLTIKTLEQGVKYFQN